MGKLVLRDEIPSDYPEIRRIHTENFRHTLEADLIDNLRKLPEYEPYLSQVLELDGKVIGHVMLTKVKIANCGSEEEALILAPVGIDGQIHGKGYGTYMVNETLKVVKKHGYKLALVYGGDYYHRFGFRSAKYVFRPNPMPGHGILLKKLGYGPKEPVGVIHYPHPFDPLINEWGI